MELESLIVYIAEERRKTKKRDMIEGIKRNDRGIHNDDGENLSAVRDNFSAHMPGS